MFNKKCLKVNFLLILLSILITFSSQNYTQTTKTDNTEKEKRFDYRRQDLNNLPPPEKYTQPKEEVFPLGWKTNTLNKVVTGTGVWTELNPKVPRVDYLGIHFVNKDTGLACGQSGAVIKTTNGGSSWTISNTPVNNLLLKIHSYNGQIVIVTGYDGIVLRSSDGGENFELIQSGVGNGFDLWGVQMLNDTLGWVAGMNQTLLKTTDTGLTWQFVNPGLNQHYWSLNFLNEDYGMIVCGGGKVLKTTDGGISWIQMQAGDTRALYTIDIIDTLHIAAAGGPYGKNVYSSDGGFTWTQNGDLGYSAGANWIQFVDTDTGYITGAGAELKKTTDRGQNWVTIGFNVNEGDWQFELLPENIGYGSGSSLTLTKTVNGYENWSRLILNDNFYDDYFFSEINGFVLSGYLYKTTDGGMTWQRIINGPGGRCIEFTNEQTGFVGSINYTRIYKTINGGDTWNETNIIGLADTTGDISKIFFININTGWAVTSRGGILKTTDGGNNWFTQLNAGISIIFSSIYFVDSLYGWTTNGNARPYKTTDGGSNWIQQTNLDFWQTNDVYFANRDTGWITNDYTSNILYRTNNGGGTWDAVSGMNQPMRFSFFPVATHWWVYGFSDLYETTDGGGNWNNITPPTQLFNRFSAPSNWLGYGVGSLGYIVKYVDSSFVPVELISFRGESIENEIILIWQTASEINNRGFYVEKSFEQVNWETIGFVQGKGTTTETNFYKFIDRLLIINKIYYRLKQVDYDGSFKYSKIVEVTIGAPTEFSLSQNYPNPFNGTTAIKYQIPKDEFIALKVYDVLGNEIKTLMEGNKKAGYYKIDFSANDLSSGIYFYKLTAGAYNSTKKFILLK